jgi:hypothetical protein
MFLCQMAALSFVLVLLPIPLVSLVILPLIMAVCGLSYSYLFALGSVYLGILLRPGDPAWAFVVTFLFKLSAVTGIPAYAVLGICFGVALPLAIFLGVLATYKPLRYITRTLLKSRVKFDC